MNVIKSKLRYGRFTSGLYRTAWMIPYYAKNVLPIHFLRMKESSRNDRVIVSCYPEVPSPASIYFKVGLVSGIRFQRPDANASLALRWEAKTISGVYPELPGVLNLNARCVDISKSQVDAIHHEVFGYGVSLDPTTAVGIGIMKSEENGLHDGVVTEFPHRNLKDGFVYQRLVDSVTPDGLVEEIRIPMIGTQVPFVYLKYRSINKRFSHPLPKTRIMKTEEILSEQELTKVKEMARKMGLNLGEMDAMRDNEDGRLYVLDVNNTPSGPPPGLSWGSRMKIFKTLGDVMKKEFL